MRTIQVIGNVGKDAELRIGENGTARLKFSLAAKGTRRGSESMWFDCTVWGKRAESLADHITKGSKLYVSGEFGARERDKGGCWFDVSVDTLEFCGGKQQTQQRDEPEADPFGGDPLA